MRKVSSYKSSQWAATHRAAVQGILSPLGIEAPPVFSRGRQFYNKDNWTARSLMNVVGQYVKYNFTGTLSFDDISYLVTQANQVQVYDYEKAIVIAETPSNLEMLAATEARRITHELQGGAYHEGLHTAYSCTRQLSVTEVWEPLNKRLPLMEPAKWKKYIPVILTWGNIIEDIRIERCGIQAFPPIKEKLVALQDLILRMEKEGKEANPHRKVNATGTALAVITCAFRDLGLGYQSFQQMQCLQSYYEDNPEAFEMVSTGELKPILDKVIALKPEDDLDHLWLAMDIVLALEGLYEEQQEQQDDGTKSDPGEGNGDEGSNEQGEAYNDEEDEQQGGTKSNSNKPPIFKVGDEAIMNGKRVRVTWAGVPDEKTGIQPLDVEVV